MNLRSTRLLTSTTFVLACVASVTACRSNEVERSGAKDSVDMELFRQLIEEGTMRPLDGFDDEESLRELERRYADPPTAPDPEAYVELPSDEPNPYMEFGSQILVYRESGLVMKPYTFPKGVGSKAFDLLRTYGDFPIHGAATNGEGLPDPTIPQPRDSVLLDLRTDWTVEAWSNPRGESNGTLEQPTAIALGDLLVVVASPSVMLEVEHFINIFMEDVKQIEIEAKIVEVTSSDSFNFGIKPIDDMTPVFGFPNPNGLVRSMDFSFPNTVDSTEALFNVGAVFDGVRFNALLEVVAAAENVSIISRPKVAVREGGRAEIVNTTEIPFFNIGNIAANGTFTTSITFKPVGVQMYVIPRVIGDDTVVLNIDIEASQQTGTAVAFAQGGGAAGGSVVTVPEISQRRARTIVRLEPGQAVILGGLISERTLEREAKIPLLGDLPILGFLFKNKFQERQQTNVLFFIRPRVLQGADLNAGFGE